MSANPSSTQAQSPIPLQLQAHSPMAVLNPASSSSSADATAPGTLKPSRTRKRLSISFTNFAPTADHHSLQQRRSVSLTTNNSGLHQAQSPSRMPSSQSSMTLSSHLTPTSSATPTTSSPLSAYSPASSLSQPNTPSGLSRSMTVSSLAAIKDAPDEDKPSPAEHHPQHPAYTYRSAKYSHSAQNSASSIGSAGSIGSYSSAGTSPDSPAAIPSGGLKNRPFRSSSITLSPNRSPGTTHVSLNSNLDDKSASISDPKSEAASTTGLQPQPPPQANNDDAGLSSGPESLPEASASTTTLTDSRAQTGLSTSSSTTTLVLQPVAASSAPIQPSQFSPLNISPVNAAGPTISSSNSNSVYNQQQYQNQPASAPSPASAASSAIEYYFSQLAYRERRIVELRDEIKRMQQKLKQAESDLEDFKKQVPTSDLIPRQSASSKPSGSQSHLHSQSAAAAAVALAATAGASSSSSSANNGPSTFSPASSSNNNNSNNQHASPLTSSNQQPTSSLRRSQSQSRRLVISHSPMASADTPLTTFSSHKTGSSAGGSGGSSPAPSVSRQGSISRRHIPLQSSTSSASSFSSRHSVSLSDSSTSSVTSSLIDPLMEEADEDDYNTSTTTIGSSTPIQGAFGSGFGATRKEMLAHASNVHNTSSTSPDPNLQRYPAHQIVVDEAGIHTGLYDSKMNPHAPGAGTTDQVLHLGKRVVEELGTQFWSFFEDIKNVTVGEDARDPLSRPGAPGSTAATPAAAGSSLSAPGHANGTSSARQTHAKSRSVMVGGSTRTPVASNVGPASQQASSPSSSSPSFPTASSSMAAPVISPPPAAASTSAVSRNRHARAPSLRRFRGSMSMHNLKGHLNDIEDEDMQATSTMEPTRQVAPRGSLTDLKVAHTKASENSYFIV